MAEAIDETEKGSIQKEIESKSAEVTSINKRYETAQTNYAAAQKTAEEKKSAYEEAKKEADSAKSSYKKATQEQEDTVRNAEESISDQEKNLENSRLNAITANSNEEDQVESLKEQIESCTIVAPVDGVVTALNVEAGEKFAGGDVVTVQDDTSFVVSATVDEYDIADVAKGMRVIVKTDATGEEELDGEITFVSPTPSTSSEGMGSSESTSGYPVEIKLNSTNERLRIGMTAKASIVLEESTDVFAVPYDAITTNEAGESVIYVIDEDTTGTTGSKGGMPTGEGGRRGAGRPDGTVSGNGAGKGGRGGFGSGIDNENAESSNASQEAGSQNVEGEMPQRPDMEGKMPQKTEIEGEMPQGSEGNTNQDVATQTRKTRAIVVTVGLESDYYTEVSSDELVEGMKVVLSTESTKESSNKEKNNTDMGSLFGGMGGSNTGGNSGGRPSAGGQRPGGF